MKFFIDENDKRNIICKRLLQDNGFNVCTVDGKFDSQDRINVFVFSPAKKFTDNEINSLPDFITLFAGNLTEFQIEMCVKKKIIYKNILKIEKFAIKNANLTMEGVLALILENTNNSIFENKYLIIGGGRISKSLAILFGKLGLNFAIGTFNEIKFPEYFLYTDNVYLKNEIYEKIKYYSVVINTIPSLIFDNENLEKIKMGTLFIETASIDCMDRTCDKNFTFLPAPALPQRFSAQSAGRVLFETIIEELS